MNSVVGKSSQAREPEKPGRRVRVLTAKELVEILKEKSFTDGWAYGRGRILFRLEDGKQVSITLSFENRLFIELLEIDNNATKGWFKSKVLKRRG
jgi:hypothetical protein